MRRAPTSAYTRNNPRGPNTLNVLHSLVLRHTINRTSPKRAQHANFEGPSCCDANRITTVCRSALRQAVNAPKHSIVNDHTHHRQHKRSNANFRVTSSARGGGGGGGSAIVRSESIHHANRCLSISLASSHAFGWLSIVLLAFRTSPSFWELLRFIRAAIFPGW